MACWTFEEIATETDATKSDVDRVLKSFSQNGNIAELGKSEQAAATHATDFDPPIYNVWKQQTKSEGSSHFGNSETRWVDKDAKEARNKRIFDLWMACETNVEIATECGCNEKTVRDVIGEMASLPKLRKQEAANAEHATDFDPPIYNVWKQQTKSEGSSHFGNSETRWVDKDAKEARNKRIFDLWMACWTQQDIADLVGETAARVNQIVADLPKLDLLGKTDQANAEHATDFDPPIYNVFSLSTGEQQCGWILRHVLWWMQLFFGCSGG